MIKTGLAIIVLGLVIIATMVAVVWNMEMGEESFWTVILSTAAGLCCIAAGIVCLVIGIVALAAPNIE